MGIGKRGGVVEEEGRNVKERRRYASVEENKRKKGGYACCAEEMKVKWGGMGKERRWLVKVGSAGFVWHVT